MQRQEPHMRMQRQEEPLLVNPSYLIGGLQANERPHLKDVDGIPKDGTHGCPLASTYIFTHVYVHTPPRICIHTHEHMYTHVCINKK